MSLFENVTCPVCNREFVSGDDIVVCPECGTPHHRDCYNYIGKCVNSGLHKNGFTFDRKNKNETSKKENEPAGMFFPAGNFQNTDENTDKKNQPFMPFGAIPELTNSIADDTDTIDGESVGDVAAAVKNNIHRFIPLFKKFENKEKSFSWNWGAFFFGSLYFFYRKMYKHAVSLISLVAALFIGYEMLLIKVAPKAMKIVQEAANLTSQNNVNEANAKILEMQNAPDFGKIATVTYGFLAVILVIRIIEAFTADKIYKTTIVTLVKRVRTQIDEGATFSTPFSGSGNINLNQEQMRKYYLSSKGGVTLFAPLIAFFAVDMLLTMI